MLQTEGVVFERRGYLLGMEGPFKIHCIMGSVGISVFWSLTNTGDEKSDYSSLFCFNFGHSFLKCVSCRQMLDTKTRDESVILKQGCKILLLSVYKRESVVATSQQGRCKVSCL